MNNIRKATSEDKPAVLEISKNIWEGDDYIPRVFDKWIADDAGEFVVIIDEGEVAGFAKLTMLTDHDAWLEGLRVDKNKRGKGLAKQLNEYFINRCRAMNPDSIRLSTYVENHESIHIIEKYGFRKVSSFLVLYSDNESTVCPPAGVEVLKIDELMTYKRKFFNDDSFLGFDWVFMKAKDELLKELALTGSIFCIRDNNGDIDGLIILSPKYNKGADQVSISHLWGKEGKLNDLLAFAGYYAKSKGYGCVHIMCPDDEIVRSSLIQKGYQSFDDRDVNVFIYEHQSTLKSS